MTLFCYQCETKVVLRGAWRRECKCQVLISRDDTPPNPADLIADTWVHYKVALACLRQVQSLAAAAGLSWQEWIEQADKCFAMVKEESPDDWQDWLERAIDHTNHYSD